MEPYPHPTSREKRQYGFISALFLSAFSSELYRDVARRWRGVCFWYLVLLMLICYVPVCIKFHYAISEFVKGDAKELASTFPTLTIQNGVASIAEPEPYLWKDPKSGKVILYVDSTGAFDIPAGQTAPLKLSKNKLIVQKNPTQSETHILPPTLNATISKETAASVLEGINQWAAPVLFVAWFVGGLLWHFVGQMVIIYGLVGLAVAAMTRSRLSYGAIMRLVAIALTPALLISLVMRVTGFDFRFSTLLILILELVVLIRAIAANSDGPQHSPGFEPMYGTPQPPPFPPPPGHYPPPPPSYPPPPPPVYPPRQQ